MSASTESKPLSAKYQRVADKKARDAAIAEAIAKGEQPPVFETKAVVAETAADDTTSAVAEKDEEKEEVNTGTLAYVEVDEVLRKKAANAASSLARRMSKKQGGKRVKFVELVEGELKKLVKLAGGTDEAIAKAVASERKHFAAIRAAKEAAATKAEVTGADGETSVTPTMTRKEKNQRDYEERQRVRALAAANAGTDAPVAADGATAPAAAATKPQEKKPQNNNKKPQQNNKNNKKAAPGANGGKKPKMDMRGLNQKQKKEKEALAAAAKKAEKDAAKKAAATAPTPVAVASE